MKTLLISGLAFAIMTGGVFAQTAAPIPPNASAPAATKSPLSISPSKGAHFRLQDGDAAVDVKCADDEPMKLCAEITLQILEKLVSLPKR
jgi:hypothetical protein